MKKKIQIVAGILLGVFLVWWLFKDTNWSAVWGAVRGAHPGWLALSGGLVFLTFFVRIVRWRHVVPFGGNVTYARLFNATQIGFLANFVLPARLGEPIRALVLTRSTGIPFAKTFAYVAVDRVLDLVGLAFALIFTVITFHPTGEIYLPGELRELYDKPVSESLIRSAAESVGLVMVAGMVVLFLVYMHRERAVRLTRWGVGLVSRRLADRAAAMMAHFTEGMAVMKSPGDMARSVSASLLLWVIFALCHWTVIRGMRLDVPWYTPFVTLSFLAVFISLPGPPGFIGPFHAAIIGGLLLVNPATDLDAARATAIVAHLLNLVPVVLAGVWSLSTERLSLVELQRESEQMEEGVDGPGAGA